MKIILTRFRVYYIFIPVFIFVCVSGGVADENYKTVHIFVPLCDNQHQKIVPVPARLGDGDDPANNLYWGALYGVKTYFNRSESWRLINCESFPDSNIVLERCVFKHLSENYYIVCDAYKGKEIKKAIVDFLSAAAGQLQDSVIMESETKRQIIFVGGNSNLVIYAGHNGLMDFDLNDLPSGPKDSLRNAVILACYSKRYFSEPIKSTGIYPLIWTTGLMAPEAYSIEAILDGYINKENYEKIRERAAKSYSRYQKCGIIAARKLFFSGW